MTDAADFPLMYTWRRAHELADEIQEVADHAPEDEKKDAKILIDALRFYAEKAREQVND